MTTPAEGAPARPERRDDDEPVLPSITRDEHAEGWGDAAADERDEQWYRRERPPHHGD